MTMDRKRANTHCIIESHCSPCSGAKPSVSRHRLGKGNLQSKNNAHSMYKPKQRPPRHGSANSSVMVSVMTGVQGEANAKLDMNRLNVRRLVYIVVERTDCTDMMVSPTRFVNEVIHEVRTHSMMIKSTTCLFVW